jgi:ABC-type antimicrobial peptide transport system permease subunit
MFKLNCRIALRNLWKNKGFTLINIGGLAIGLASCLMLLLYVAYEWSFDKQFDNIDRIYAVYDHSRMSDQINTSRESDTPTQLAGTIAESVPGVEHVTRLVENGAMLKYKNNTFMKKVLYVDPAFLKMFNYVFIKGDPSTALTTPNSILLTAKLAKAIFGAQNPVGQTLSFENRKNLLVTAVIKDLPENQSYQFDMLMPWAFLMQDNSNYTNMGWTDGALSTIVQLKDSSMFTAADAQVRKIFKLNHPTADFKEFFLFPYKKSHLYNQFENGKLVGGKIDDVKLYLLLAVCILFLACINYMNLSTARSEKRAREVGVRKSLGSSRRSLAFQFILESILLSFVAMLVAFVLLEISLPYFNRILEINMTVSYGAYQVWLTVVSLVLITGFLAGSYPSFYLSSFVPVKVLKGFKGADKSALPVRKMLVVLQFCCSICMIIFAVVVYHQIQYMKDKPLGFDQNNLVQEYRMGPLMDYRKMKLLKAQLLESGAVTSVTANSGSLTNTSLSTEVIRWPGQQHKEQVEIQLRFVDYDFTSTIAVKMLQGRDFSAKFGADSMAVILNESAVKTMNLKDPLGKQITNEDWGQTLHIIGVMKDYNYLSPGAKVGPMLFFLNERHAQMLIMRLNPEENISASVSKIKALTMKANPGYPVDVEFVSDKLAEKLKKERMLSVLSNVFGGFAILISCVGLLGLALYMAEQRSKEISIRKVLGADLRNILVLLNKDFIRLVLVANLIAVPVAYVVVQKWLQNYDYKIAITPMPFLVAFLLSLLIAVLTVSLQTFKVAKANPVDALKYE